MFTPNVIPNKHTAKVKFSMKRPRKKLDCALCISVENKIKRNLFTENNTTGETVCSSFVRVSKKPTSEKLNYGLCEKGKFLYPQRFIHPKIFTSIHFFHWLLSNGMLCPNMLYVYQLLTRSRRQLVDYSTPGPRSNVVFNLIYDLLSFSLTSFICSYFY